MSEISVTTRIAGQGELIRFLKRHPARIARTTESIVRQEGRGLSVELARNTRPFGFAPKARKSGEKAVARDIGKVYASPSEVVGELAMYDRASADAYWAAVQNRRHARAKAILGRGLRSARRGNIAA